MSTGILFEKYHARIMYYDYDCEPTQEVLVQTHSLNFKVLVTTMEFLRP